MGTINLEHSSERVIFSFVKNRSETVRASVGPYKGHLVADFRIWVETADGTQLPSKRGIAIRVEQLPELAEAVAAVLDELQEAA